MIEWTDKERMKVATSIGMSMREESAAGITSSRARELSDLIVYVLNLSAPMLNANLDKFEGFL